MCRHRLRSPSHRPHPASQRTVLTTREWSHLVERLNASSRSKQLAILQAQHKRIADELSGLSFTPAISDKSRELAAANKSLPDRVAALMRKKKARLDAIRHEKAQAELAEATFKPRINDYKPSRAAASAKAVQRKISHLLQFVSGAAAVGRAQACCSCGWGFPLQRRHRRTPVSPTAHASHATPARRRRRWTAACARTSAGC
jgi:hypothetical protein